MSAITANEIATAVTGGQGITDQGQLAAIVTATSLLGGAAAGLLGQNALAAMTAAQNETLNNTCGGNHNCGEDPEKLNEHTYTHQIVPQGSGPIDEEQAGETIVAGKGTPPAGNPSATVSQADLNTLAANGVKFTPQNVVATGTTPSGQIVFLETGNSSAGLQHIVDGHASDFANIGVSEAQIPSVVMQTVTEGNIVGYQGSGTGRPIYQTTINGQPQRIAVTIGSNGFIVGANPAGRGK